MAVKKNRAGFFRHIFVLPFALVMLVPLLIFDFCLSVFHRIVFALCKMKRVNRAAHFKLDQMKIAQLGKLSRLFAIYIYYARGLMSYAGKIAAECDQYWCTPRAVKGRQKMMIDKSKLGVKDLKAFNQSQKQKPKKSRKK